MKFRRDRCKTNGSWWQQCYLRGAIRNRSDTWPGGAGNPRLREKPLTGERESERIAHAHPSQERQATGTRIARRPARAVAAGLVLGALAACSPSAGATEATYASDYTAHEPLRVVGYPSTGSLRVTQETVWRIADGTAEQLAALATGDGSENEARKTADNWIKGFRKGARGKVTADFYDEGSERQTVVLYFHGTRQVKELSVRLDGNAGEDGWHVLMRETTPTEATAAPTWAPPTPGGLGSTSTRR
ncbi:hypothetical protein [Streptomyces sp. NPDC003077]|uniref:hypothetical protein n=1 Tax=Streptomyces sp. NPDC003077 TaxID=3154443 RepID=UPI0033BE1471